jgi:hypothetical protein
MCGGFYVPRILLASNSELYANNTTINIVPISKKEGGREEGTKETSTTSTGRCEMQF